MHEKAKYFYVTEFYKQEPLKSKKIQFKFLETFEVSYLWFINNLS